MLIRFVLLLIGPLAVLPAALGQEPISVLAIAGEPFGVARVRLPSQSGESGAAHQSVSVTDAEGRVYYPATRSLTETRRSGPPLVDIPPGRGVGEGRLLGRITNAVRLLQSEEVERTVAHDVWFLFRGSEPFTAVLGDAHRTRVTITPQAGSARGGGAPLGGGAVRGGDPHRTALLDWWSVYTESVARNIRNGDYPPLVETYLAAMLSGRLALPLPEELQADAGEEATSIATTLELVAGTEQMRNRVLERVAQGDTERDASADLPVPAPPQWQLPPPPIVSDVAVEPIASRVPADCFYLRFGSFTNYLWFRDLSNQYGGDITRMVTLRGFDYGATRRTEARLVLKATELSRVMGPTVVDDMAFVGSDMFLTEGPSIGVLMKAKNVFLLGTSLRNDRNQAARTIPGATMRDVEIDGKTVSFLSTPDNRVRSFMVNDGEYFFVSTSETLVRQFLETGRGGASLADNEQFRYARELMPSETDYTMFAFFSTGFLQGLVSPQYQIELRRRLYATADIALVQLAQTAAAGEGQRLTEIDALIAAGFLPAGIGRRPDGSGPIVAGAEVIDSRRGSRGSFLPIADVEVTGVTPEEAAWYAERADFYSRQWQQMDPIIAGLRRVEVPGAAGWERLEIHTEVAPLVPEKYGWIAEQLGPPTRVAIRFAPDDIAAIQAHVVSDQMGGSIPPHHLFAAIKDTLPPNPAEIEGLLDKYRALKSLAAYVGGWPQPGIVDQLPLGLGNGRPVGPGMSRLIGGVYRYQGGGFSILSFMPDVIHASLPYLAAAEAVEPAQVRLHVDNLQGTQLEQWVSEQLYARNYQTSLAGARLLDSLTQQLKVDQDAAAEVAATLLDAELQCPLGGEYVLRSDGGATRWVSTAWADASSPEVMPAGYTPPLLRWFRGTAARLTQYDARLVLDAVVDMEGADGRVPASPEQPPAQRQSPAQEVPGNLPGNAPAGDTLPPGTSSLPPPSEILPAGATTPRGPGRKASL
ncbi:hypothetical protein [Candidatus Laterigemmans baculatus]|uniref:hypothetical protein n=1 Tax=Candidatus Laterigemmans baculatus TaxID=2770505 RepID=UPI0013D9151C|nr:hypothetical protein [Candidatus Laterigemmans baculatus]